MKLMKLVGAIAFAGAFVSVPVVAQTTIEIGYATAPTSHYGVGSAAFCEDLEKRTSGRYKCQMFANSALGGEREMIEAVQLGTLDVVEHLDRTRSATSCRRSNIVDIPFLFRDYDHARACSTARSARRLLAKFPSKGLIALAWTENGFRHLTNSSAPIIKPDDVKGLKIRSMQNKVHIQAFQSIGIQPTPMAFSELFTRLQQGTVDGQENPIPVILSAKFVAGAEAPVADRSRVLAGAADRCRRRCGTSCRTPTRPHSAKRRKAGSAAQRKKVNDDERDGIAQLRAAAWRS